MMFDSEKELKRKGKNCILKQMHQVDLSDGFEIQMTEIITIFCVIKIRHGNFSEHFLGLYVLALRPLIRLVLCSHNVPSPEEGFPVSCHTKTSPNLSRNCQTISSDTLPVIALFLAFEGEGVIPPSHELRGSWKNKDQGSRLQEKTCLLFLQLPEIASQWNSI